MTRSARTVALATLLTLSGCAEGRAQDRTTKAPPLKPEAGEQLATFAGGCFWCMEPPFEGRPGVRAVVSGYTGGPEQNPSYKQVSWGKTGHTEAVQIAFDPSVISYAELVEIFWKSMDPTDDEGQFADRGAHYRPEIFVHDAEQRAAAEASKEALASSGKFQKPIVVPISDAATFWPAEVYHQDYYKKNPTHYYRYRKGSGREGFLKKVWGADASGALSRPKGSDEAKPAATPASRPTSRPASRPAGGK
jgi:methionine-S-sulfoxide reductase